jgi:hypothetical protein
MSKESELKRLGETEEELEAACATLASLIEPGDDLRRMAADHRRGAALLVGVRPRVRPLLSSMRAALTALVRDEDRALAWLRDREHQLVRAYLALDCRQDLVEAERELVRRFLLPAAFERFTRIDRTLALRVSEPAAV